MTITHHLTDQILLAHAGGALSEAFGLVVAAHLSMCDDCRARLGAFEAVGGAILETCGTVPVDDGGLAATFARIDAADRRTAPAPRRARGPLPGPIADYIGGGLDDVRWKPAGMGVRQAVLCTAEGATARLLHIPAGVAVPDHGHRGLEMTLVLRGAFRDEGMRFGPGDVEIADAATEHTPVAEHGADCICLAATDAPLRFNAFLPRIAQSFLRI
ncbi:MAG: ChrR family anti-sigma-E factor [Gemmobacter sp.]|jgi:putative transcriptional regulator